MTTASVTPARKPAAMRRGPVRAPLCIVDGSNKGFIWIFTRDYINDLYGYWIIMDTGPHSAWMAVIKDSYGYWIFYIHYMGIWVRYVDMRRGPVRDPLCMDGSNKQIRDL